MKRIFNLLILILFIISSTAALAYAAQGKSLFTPCQYKNSYKYYMSRGEDYLDDNQPESALLSFKRALIIQPNSKDARLKIITAKEMVSSGKRPRLLRTKRKAVQDAMRYAETQARRKIYKPAPAQQKAITTTSPKISTKRTSPYMESKIRYEKESPSQLKNLQAKKKPEITDSDLALKYPSADSAASHRPAPSSFDEFYNEYLDLEKFNNGINNKIQQAGSSINKGIAPNKVTGEYRIALGFTNDDVIWKDANADYHNMPGDTSWRYIFGQNRHNTYDKGIYSRLKINVENYITDTLSSYNEIVIDPWTFVGKNRVYVPGSGGDNVQMDLKYWSNVSKTINETYRTENGDIVNVQEIKVHDGKTSPERFTGLSDWGSNRFSISEMDINRQYVPVRKSWIEYKDEPYHAKAFFMSSQDEALTSDDPMRLSNNKVWWEESPWLDRYEPSRVFNRAGVSAPAEFNRTREPLKKGQWVRNLSFVARDSDDQRLTFLRGVSLDANFDSGTSVNIVAASPRNLWDRYEQGSSVPAAVRIKQSPVAGNLSLGALYTSKTGMRHNSIEAMNNLLALDGAYLISPNIELLAEGAVSFMDVEEAIGYENEYKGYAGMVGFKNQGSLPITGGSTDRYELDASFAHMDDTFFPGLSNYRFTRKEFEFAKHIYFDDMNPENEAIKMGDGMDVARNAFKVTAKGELPDNNIDARFDFRTVHSDDWDFIEHAYRLEGKYQPTSKLTLKGLGYYLYLPKTVNGIDPLINAKNSYTAFTDYFAYEDVWLENSIIEAGSDPSIGAFSGGLKYDFTNYFSGSGIFEFTNDPKDWPRGLLNNVYVTDEYRDGVIWDQIVPFLYDQSVFGVPPYTYYGIYKARFEYFPFDPLKIVLNYVYNENKYAMAIDENSTHQGIEIEYKLTNRMTLGLLYQYTRQNDIYKEFVLRTGDEYVGHHNIFASLDYDLNENQHLTVMFGEFVGGSYAYPEEHSSLAALDTQHIVRVAYSGDWGAPYSESPDTSLKSSPNELGKLNPSIPGAKFVTNIYAGRTEYEEDVQIAPAESDWDSLYGKLEFGLDAYDREYWEGSFRFGLFGTITDEEEWTYEGQGTYQRNDMGFRGADVNTNIGWA